MSLTVNSLPIEILTQIFGYLNISDKKDVALVCKRWYDACTEPRLQMNVVISLNASLHGSKPLAGLISRAGFHLSLTDVDGSQNADETLGQCYTNLRHKLLSLNLKGSTLSELSLISVLSSCENLSTLDISCCNSLFLSGNLLVKRLADLSLPKLVSINLSSLHHLSDATFVAFMSATPNLERLDLAAVPMMFANVPVYASQSQRPSTAALTFERFIQQVTKLTDTLVSLDLSRTGINDTALKVLAGMKGLRLQDVSLVACKDLGNSGIEALVQAQAYIQRLNLAHNSQLGDLTIKSVAANLSDLKKLNVTKVAMKDSCMKALSSLEVKELVLSGCLHDDIPKASCEATFKQWSRNMSKLDMSFCAALSNSTLSMLCQFLGNLTELRLTSCFHLNDSTVKEIARSMRRLTVLSISWCKKVTDLGLLGLSSDRFIKDQLPECRCTRHLASCQNPNPYFVYAPPVKDIAPADVIPSKSQILGALDELEKELPYPLLLLERLTVLDLSNCQKLTDNSLAKVIKFASLRELDLSMCFRLTDESVVAIASANPLLERINLNDCKDITDEGICALINGCRRLSHLRVSNCTRLTDIIIDEMLRKRMRLKYIDISFCSVSPGAIERLERLMPSLLLIQKRFTTSGEQQ